MIYYCEKENNTCGIKETCTRYLDKNELRANLFKAACTEENNHVLYIKKKEET